MDPIADLRKDYTRGGLDRADLDPDAVSQFQKWFDQALAARVPEPNAMTLATADEAGRPSARIVLLKGVSPEGFRFFTQYESLKGRCLDKNPHAALVFYWPELERQVNITGPVARLSREESKSYHRSRPRGNRLGAWASQQDRPVPDRAALDAALADADRRFPGEEVPMPPTWGGYRLRPERMEFWQGRSNRLHDRFVYLRQAADGWTIERLSP